MVKFVLLSRFSYVYLCSAENKKQQDEHAAALMKEQDEVARLKAELAELKDKHREEIKSFPHEQIRQEDECRTLRELASKAEVDGNLAKQDVKKL